MPRSDIPFSQYEHIRTWKAEGFRLELFNTHTLHHGGPQQRIAYQLFDSDWHTHAGVLPKEVRIFAGDDFGCSPMDSIDGDGCVAGLLGFLSLRPGDTDADYFDDYTEEQKAWCDARAEYLSMLQNDLEEASNASCILCGKDNGGAFFLTCYQEPAIHEDARIYICEDCARHVALREQWNAVPGYETEGD